MRSKYVEDIQRKTSSLMKVDMFKEPTPEENAAWAARRANNMPACGNLNFPMVSAFDRPGKPSWRDRFLSAMAHKDPPPPTAEQDPC